VKRQSIKALQQVNGAAQQIKDEKDAAELV
jgi:hypothetical protein